MKYIKQLTIIALICGVQSKALDPVYQFKKNVEDLEVISATLIYRKQEKLVHPDTIKSKILEIHNSLKIIVGTPTIDKQTMTNVSKNLTHYYQLWSKWENHDFDKYVSGLEMNKAESIRDIIIAFESNAKKEKGFIEEIAHKLGLTSKLSTIKATSTISITTKVFSVPSDWSQKTTKTTHTRSQEKLAPTFFNVSTKRMLARVSDASTLFYLSPGKTSLDPIKTATTQVTISCEGFNDLKIDLKSLKPGTLYIALDAGSILFGKPQLKKAIGYKAMTKAEAQAAYPKYMPAIEKARNNWFAAQ